MFSENLFPGSIVVRNSCPDKVNRSQLNEKGDPFY